MEAQAITHRGDRGIGSGRWSSGAQQSNIAHVASRTPQNHRSGVAEVRSDSQPHQHPSPTRGCLFVIDTRPEAGFVLPIGTRGDRDRSGRTALTEFAHDLRVREPGDASRSRLECPVDELPRDWLVAAGKVHPTLSKLYPLAETGQAVLDVHSNAHQGKARVLCLAPREGLGVSDNQRRERHAEQINRFPEAERGASLPVTRGSRRPILHEASNGSGASQFAPQSAKGSVSRA